MVHSQSSLSEGALAFVCLQRSPSPLQIPVQILREDYQLLALGFWGSPWLSLHALPAVSWAVAASWHQHSSSSANPGQAHPTAHSIQLAEGAGGSPGGSQGLPSPRGAFHPLLHRCWLWLVSDMHQLQSNSLQPLAKSALEQLS